MKKIWETGIILFAVMGFWGMIYPDLCFTEDVCRIVYEDTYGKAEEIEKVEDFEKKEEKKSQSGADMFTQVCRAEPEQVRIKSAFLEYLSGMGKEAGGKSSKQGIQTPQTAKERVSKIESKGNDNGGNKGNRGNK
ncbi:MAG: hypothetical protein GX235_13085 [Clostridiales bacterium]|nr:hypothetical protein [Clostridiales bacterium]